ncbi:MAG: AAA family ATPase [Gammaproteobacteria bacterium]|nr:AAA family ATPase [Gammaproteobacteria bacterium]
MYDEHFGLKETPFTIAPDPRFLYMSERHREALAHLVYGFEMDGGFILLTGEVGTGKTTISRCLLEQLPDNTNVAMVLNPKVSSNELLETICDELHIDYPAGAASLKAFIDRINGYLLESNAMGRKVVVIVEEAQNLAFDVLEQLRLLTNLETNQRKLLQIILIGQPELLTLLARPELRQLEQRITARYHLLPLSKKDSIDYVKHRLGVAGVKDPLFSFAVLKKVYDYSGGIPRKINLLCDRAMLGAYVENRRYIDKKILKRAALEVFGNAGKNIYFAKKTMVWTAVVSVLVVGGAGFSAAYYRNHSAELVSTLEGGNNDPVVAAVMAGSSEDALVQADEFLDFIDAQPVGNSKQLAFSALFYEWGELYDPKTGGRPCDYAAAKGLNCLFKNGNLRSLRHLNRPAILKLLTQSGKPLYVTIISLKDQVAKLIVSSQTKHTSVANLEKRWFGDYTVLWHSPPHYTGPLRPGAQGPGVEWLATQLAEVSGGAISSNGMVSYDSSLIAQVKLFQLKQGLESDGIAGAQTLIHLNSVTSKSVPRLM